MKQKIKIFLSIIIVISFIIFLIINLNSLKIEVLKNGYSNFEIIERGYDNNDNEFRVIKMKNNQNFALAYLVKNNLGFWKIWDIQESSLKNNKYVTVGWNKTVGLTYNENDNSSNILWEWHSLYYGTNAIKPIKIDSNKIPIGVAFYIQQGQGDYLINFITYNNPEVLNQIDISNLIKDYVTSEK